MTRGPHHTGNAQTAAHHNGNHPHHRADVPTVSHRHQHHEQGAGHPETTRRPTSARGHQHDVHAGHDKHAGHSVEMFRQKFWGTLLLSVPTIVWAPMIQHWFGYAAPGGPLASRWIPALFGSLVFVYGGWVFIRGARGEIVDRRPGMMTLIALAITVAFAFQRWRSRSGFPGMDLWWELATLVTIMVLGHWVEMRSISQAQGALNELAKLLPDTAMRFVGERMEEVPASELRKGDLILVRPGASIPADGTVREGTSDVNESMITGESRPVPKTSRRPRHRRNRERLRLSARRGHWHRRKDRARRHHAARRPGANIALARTGARRPSGLRTHDCGGRRRGPYACRMVHRWSTARVRHRAGRDGPRDCVSACARARHSAGGGHFDDARREKWPARARQARTRGGAQSRCGVLRQDGNAHARRVSGRGDHDASRNERRRSARPGRGGRTRFRTHDRPRHRQERRGASAVDPESGGVPARSRDMASRPSWRTGSFSWAAPRCCAHSM